ncbi:YgaP family membrane protein [Peribacillus sp. JNUCC 23]|uniref:YgaP family membrane protein n=1 Tax=Peribacillus sp. NPDC096379 TaxID=3364393 RepID=UPI003819FF67
MKVKANIGIPNALLRITCGFTFLAWSISKMSRKPWKGSYLVIAMCSGMKIGEGILRFCPFVALYEKCQGRLSGNHNIIKKGEHLLTQMGMGNDLISDDENTET